MNFMWKKQKYNKINQKTSIKMIKKKIKIEDYKESLLDLLKVLENLKS